MLEERIKIIKEEIDFVKWLNVYLETEHPAYEILIKEELQTIRQFWGKDAYDYFLDIYTKAKSN